MSVDKRRKILEAVLEEVPAEMTDHGFGRDTCVLSSWVGREVLRRFGIAAKPVAVRAVVLNAAFWEDIDGDWEKVLDGDPELELREESWSVALGFVEAGKELEG